MSTKLKSAILLLLTLLIGVIGGVLGSRLYLEHRMQKFRATRGERFIQQRLEQLLMPTPKQSAAMDSIFEKYQPKFLELNLQFRTASQLLLDTLHTELEPLLTEEQNKQLEERRSMQPFDRPFGRPGPGRGPGPMMGKPQMRRFDRDDRPMPPRDAPPQP